MHGFKPPDSSPSLILHVLSVSLILCSHAIFLIVSVKVSPEMHTSLAGTTIDTQRGASTAA